MIVLDASTVLEVLLRTPPGTVLEARLFDPAETLHAPHLIDVEGVQDQIDASVEDAVKLARSRLPDGESLTHCEECETVIPDARRKAIPGVRLCVDCQSEFEKRQPIPTGYNRRGSKDSQLR